MRWLALAVLAGVAAVGGLRLHSTTTGVKAMTQQALMSRLAQLLEGEQGLAVHKIDCATVYEDQLGGHNACYGSHLGTEELVSRIQKRVDQLAYSGGWSNDYGIWGSFYEVRDPSKQTFGITVSPVKGDIELEAVKEVKAFANLITVTVDRPKSAR